MKTIKITLALCCLLLLGGMTIFAQDNRSYKETRPVGEFFQECLKRMIQTDNPNDARNARGDWQRFCFQLGAPGREADKAEAVKLMTEAITQDANANAHFWLIRQLGRLGDGSCVTAIAKFLDSDDRLIRDEALWSLANIPNIDAAVALRDRLSKETDADKKIALQNAIDYRKERAPVTLRSLDEIFKVMENSDKTAWDEALPQLAWLPDAKIADVPNFQQRFARLTPEAQILLMDALTAIRDVKALSLAEYLVLNFAPMQSDADEEVRKAKEKLQLAGFRALGVMALNPVTLLDNILAEGEVWLTVRDSLAKWNYGDADQQLMTAARFVKDEARRNRLLEAISLRRATCFIPLFEEFLSHENDNTRNISVGGLEGIADARAIPTLVNRWFLENENKGLKDRIENVIVNLSARLSDADGRGEALCRVADSRNDAEKAAMLPMIGRVGGQRAKELVLNMLNTGSDALKNAAFQALCNWPDASVADELAGLAQGDDAKARQASRAYIRIVTLREERPVAESMKLFENAMSLAKSTEDRQLLLTRIETARSMEVFRYAVKFLDDAELQQAACRAAIDMANDHGFYVNNRKEIDPVLDKVMNITQDNSHKERIIRYKERM